MKLKDIGPGRREREPRYIKLRISINRDEYARIRSLADMYCNSNMSEWMRYASIKHKPRATDMLFDETSPHDGRVSGKRTKKHRKPYQKPIILKKKEPELRQDSEWDDEEEEYD